MRIEKIKTRGALFVFNNNTQWDLNIHVICAKRYNYIIDTGLGSLSITPILDYLQQSEKPIVVINTHYHWDHIWGNAAVPSHMIISHALCSELIRVNWDAMLQKHKRYCFGDVSLCIPNLTLDSELYFPVDKIRIFYTPGHTMDSISVLDEQDGVLNAGDNIGDTVEELLPSLACDENLYRQTLQKYQTLDFDTCISGHNIVLSKAIIERIQGLLS